jgi:Cell Wall Hydrolase
MHRQVIGLLAAGCLLAAPTQLAAPTNAAYLPDHVTPVVTPAVVTDLFERDVVSETDLYCMTLAIFFEGGSTGEPEVGMRHIARVIAERAKANRREWGGPTICGVVFYKRSKCQFSFACLPLARRTPKPGPAWDASREIARAELEGRNDETPDLIRYYMNAPLSNPRSACMFRKEFVRVTIAGRHEFFREASTTERRELAAQSHHDCHRYAASLKKGKSKKYAKHGKSKKYAKKPSNKKYASKSGRRG